MAPSKKVKYFILVTIMPILSIMVIFSYAFIHIQNEISTLSSKITALSIIKNIEEAIFDIQRTRGLSCIEMPSQKSTEKAQLFRKNLLSNLGSLRKKLVLLKQDSALKTELSEFLSFAEKNILQDLNFEQYTDFINKFMLFSHRISYSFKLPLESKLNDHILANNIVYILPEIIEHNAQIRAFASSLSNKDFLGNQEKTILTQMEKIKEKLNKLENNLVLLYKSSQYSEIRGHHKKMIKAQNDITSYTKNELFDDNISQEPNDIFEHMTKNIDFIIELYNSHISYLNKSLKENKKLSVYILIAGFLSMLFVIYVNILLFYKNRKFVDTIEELTITDSMTGLYNRRHFDEVFENNLKIQQRTNQTLVFIILDIDFFKEYNDTYGHQAGDIAIETVSKKLKSHLRRAGDMAFRLGGEEFGLLCIGMSESEAVSFANTIREAIENEKLEHKKNKVCKYLTVSMGVCVIRSDVIHSTSEAYKCADKALYKAKDDGRNKVVVYDTQVFS